MSLQRYFLIYLSLTALDLVLFWSLPHLFVAFQVLLIPFGMTCVDYHVKAREFLRGLPATTFQPTNSRLRNWYIEIGRKLLPHDVMIPYIKKMDGTAEAVLQQMDAKEVVTSQDIQEMILQHFNVHNNVLFRFLQGLFPTVLDLAIDHGHWSTQALLVALTVTLRYSLTCNEIAATLYMDTAARVFLHKFAMQETHIQITNIHVVAASLIAGRPTRYRPPLNIHHQHQHDNNNKNNKLDKVPFSLSPGFQCPGYATTAKTLRVLAAYNQRHQWDVTVHDRGGCVMWPVPTFTATKNAPKQKKCVSVSPQKRERVL